LRIRNKIVSQNSVDTSAKSQAIATFHAELAAAQDEGRYDDWLSGFLPDAVYTAITAGNLRESGPSLFTDFGVDGLKERAAYWLGMWQVGRARIRHVVGYPRLLSEPGKNGCARASTAFMITRVAHDGLILLHTSGYYQDDLVNGDDGLKLAFRQVVVDCAVLPSNFTDPL
jgi:3-phenylpropionate/cinnamic acid dioxygenase small subunit